MYAWHEVLRFGPSFRAWFCYNVARQIAAGIGLFRFVVHHGSLDRFMAGPSKRDTAWPRENQKHWIARMSSSLVAGPASWPG
ncbi:hypothetical protein [Paraburkholderia sp. Cpub6]|uniref:hypothetical protein n=1 Tax=Paraburkholderia sp. Cpub6 TaxID=2723094 RepID=UPI0018038BE4|nr:hypothetical protein [Paraburkholderia sp. Cpub6]MBB5457865.1 hypothetical protein [Paraburkholderia sp. Cpub6]